MFKSIHPAIEVGFILLVLAMLMAVKPCAAEPKVKYCKNATTGEIITVPADMPCPYPTHEL